MLAALHAFAALASLATLSVPAAAQPTVAVLGLSAESGDEELARTLTDKLRAKAAGSPEWTVSSTGASLDQVMMVNDCESVDSACLAKVAAGLDVEQLIYGKIAKSSSPPALHAEVNLYSSAGTRTASADIPDRTDLDPVAVDLVRQLAPEPEPTPAATAPPEPVPAAAQESEPVSEASRISLDWLGYALLGVAVGSVGVAVFSWVQIDRATSNDSYDLYRRQAGAVDPTATDVCARADAGQRYGVAEPTFAEVRDQCSMGKTFEVLQYVFLATAVVSAGAGTYILVTSDSSDTASAGRRLALRPSVGPGSAAISASLRF